MIGNFLFTFFFTDVLEKLFEKKEGEESGKQKCIQGKA